MAVSLSLVPRPYSSLHFQWTDVIACEGSGAGVLILPGELLARGYSTQHPEDKTSYKSENKRLQNGICFIIK